MWKRKYVTYKKLAEALKRNDISRYGKVATLLLDTFVYGDGELKASRVISDGLCHEGKFNLWRQDLVRNGWISHCPKSYSKHNVGPKLLKYVNEEKIKTKSIATTDQLTSLELSTQGKMDKLEARVNKLEQVQSRIVEFIDPPTNDKKLKKLENGGYDSHLKLIPK